jgi:PAS domain S-box-containing protein
MFRRLKIGSKVLIVTILISLTAILVSSIVSGLTARNALERAAFERLTAVRELKAQQIEEYLDLIRKQIQSLSFDRTTIAAVKSLRNGVFQIEAGVDGYEGPLLEPVQNFYKDVFLQRFIEVKGGDTEDVTLSNIVPNDLVTLFLQLSYVVESDANEQRKSLMGDRADLSYRSSHHLIHQRLKSFLARFGYYDIFLIEPENGRVVYSVAKEMDFGTSLFDGTHSDSNLAHAAKDAMTLGPGGVAFADFKKYGPSYNAPAAFVSAPIFDNSNLIGVIAFQLPVNRINQIMTSNEAWADVGLGTSGETYLVGHDLLLRNQSRFLIEDRDEYLEMILEIGTDESIVRQIDSLNTSIGLQVVDTDGTRAALAGETGEQIFPDYRGVEVLSSFRPLKLPGLDWIIMSEIDEAEAFAASDDLIDYLVIIASLIVALTIFGAYYFSLSLTRPLRALGAGAAKLSAGELEKPIPVHSADEIGDLARNFETMRIAMRKSFAEVEKQKAVLESMISLRTAELEEASAKLTLALSNMPNGIATLDSELELTMHNDRFAELLNIPKDMVADGKPMRDVVRFQADRGDYGDGSPVVLAADQVSQLKKSSNGSAIIQTPEGKTIQLRHVIVDGGSVVTVAADITEIKKKEHDLQSQNEKLQTMQHELKESEQRIAKIIESSPDGVVTMDRQGIIQSFSNSAEQMTGYFSHEIVGRNIKVLMPKSIALEHDYYLEKYTPGNPSSVVGRRRIVDAVRKDGSIFPLEVAVEEVWLEDELTFIGLMQDITERIEMEKEIRLAREEAENASKAKSAFLANMSHELRTPMNAIIGYSEMLAEDAEDEGLDDTLADLQKISAAGKHLLSLINDVLDLSKIEAGKMELFLEDFSVAEMVDDIASTGASLIQKNNNKLEVAVAEDVGEIHSDATKVRQILFNLISNAAKFTKEGTITLEALPETRDSARWVSFVVRDTGIGIPEEKLDRIFQEFSQADETTTKDYGGTGLGLSLTKRFVEMMGGSVRVESVVGVGSSFIVELPAVVVQKHEGLEAEAACESPTDEDVTLEKEPAYDEVLEESESELAGTSVSAGMPTVLVIDDEQNARDLLKRSLQGDGCHVVTAKSGAEGLSAAAKLRPDLITLDVMMPGMDGWEVLKKLKADPDLRDVPVIMISMIGDKALSSSLGAVEAMQKPIDRGQLKRLVSRFAQSHVKRALVIEDDPAARAIIKRGLESMKWNVDEAENGAVGLEKSLDSEFGLILLDLMMPVMDGFEYLHRLRGSDGPSASAPVVVVTAKTLNAQDRAILLDNVEDVVSKSGREIDDVMNEVRESLFGITADGLDDEETGGPKD